MNSQAIRCFAGDSKPSILGVPSFMEPPLSGYSDVSNSFFFPQNKGIALGSNGEIDFGSQSSQKVSKSDCGRGDIPRDWITKN